MGDKERDMIGMRGVIRMGERDRQIDTFEVVCERDRMGDKICVMDRKSLYLSVCLSLPLDIFIYVYIYPSICI